MQVTWADPVLPPRGDEHRIVVKFNDSLKARPTNDGTLSVIAARHSENLTEIADRHDLQFEPYFPGMGQALAEIEQRSATLSGNAQGDFRGITTVTPDRAESVLELATQLNSLEVVEYAYIEATDVMHASPGDIAPPTSDLVVHQAWRGADPGRHLCARERLRDVWNGP